MRDELGGEGRGEGEEEWDLHRAESLRGCGGEGGVEGHVFVKEGEGVWGEDIVSGLEGLSVDGEARAGGGAAACRN